MHAEAAAICSHIVAILRDHGARELRTKARLRFLVENWSVENFAKSWNVALIVRLPPWE